jgi:hypothetical protein
MNKSTFTKHQKWIALLVTFTFAWLLQVSAMPLAATGTTEHVAAASAGQATGFVEQIGDVWAKPRTSPVILILGVIVLSLLIVLIRGGFGRDTAPRTAIGTSETNR